jgi:protein gp37
MQKTGIQWTECSWNPSSGCTKVSPGCKHCYAEVITRRWPKGFPNGFAFTLHPERYRQPLSWRKPRSVFVNSMSDLFHEDMPLEVLQELFGVMAACPQHTFQILTKRHKRLAELAPQLHWAPNIWMGVSIENQQYATRADYLRQVPATVRFISAEPLLDSLTLNLEGIHWVIVGGESQVDCRPMDIQWARALRDQCREAGIAYFLKQLGGHPNERGQLSDFPVDLRIREWPVRVAQPELF